MSLEQFFYCAPCRLKVLVVPLGNVRASCFADCVELLHRHGAIVPLKSLNGEGLAQVMFSPSAFPEGQLLFQYVTAWDHSYSYLEDFQQWRRLFAVDEVILRRISDCNDRSFRLKMSRVIPQMTSKNRRSNTWGPRFSAPVFVIFADTNVIPA